MCGIAGVYTLKAPVQLEQLKTMTDVLKHRGPDGEGQWISENKLVGLGHRRLSIIDLSDLGKQPMQYMNRYTLTFNGEIYNYLELKQQLLQKGYQFHSKTDTEVLLALYDLKKEKCLQELDGMFAFAIWDEQEQTLFCARDRFGEKPFFYYHEPGKQFVFASEIKALLAYGIQKKINNGMLYNYIADEWIENPYDKSQTFYEGIQKLEAAHFIIIKNNLAVKPVCYWTLNLEHKINCSFEDAVLQFRELFERSVRTKLRSDVAVGSSLSGGLDSSTIVCLLDSFNLSSQKTFSASFPGFEKDETKYMQSVVNKTKVIPHYTTPNVETLVNDLDEIFYHQEQPFSSASILAQWEVMKLAKQESTIVLLDGQGADEVLGGYTYYFRTFFQELYASDRANFHAEYQAYKKWGGNHFEVDLKFKLQARFPGLYNSYLNLRSGPVEHPDMHPDFYSHHKATTPAPLTFKPSLSNHTNNTLRVNGMMEALLRYADRNSMAFSREVRLPFLNHQLVEFVYSLPSTYKIHNGWTKYLLRKSYEGLLPNEITWRKDKIGYAPPEKQWMSDVRAKQMLEESISFLSAEKILNKNKLNPAKMWVYLMSSKLLRNE
jgi:asparagine synthase (glutamine-hydrolysing)